jgi:hypothetical protein
MGAHHRSIEVAAPAETGVRDGLLLVGLRSRFSDDLATAGKPVRLGHVRCEAESRCTVETRQAEPPRWVGTPS